MQAKSGIFRYFKNPVEPWHIQNPSIFLTLANLEPEAYSEPWYIQNAGILRYLVYSEPWHDGFFLYFRKGIFRTPAYSEPEAYSEPWSVLQK